MHRRLTVPDPNLAGRRHEHPRIITNPEPKPKKKSKKQAKPKRLSPSAVVQWSDNPASRMSAVGEWWVSGVWVGQVGSLTAPEIRGMRVPTCPGPSQAYPRIQWRTLVREVGPQWGTRLI